MKSTMTIRAITLAIIFIISCTPKLEPIALEVPQAPEIPLPPPLPARAKNVIFLIGDGMGITQITSAMIQSKKTLNFERFKHIGFHKNASADDLITDSAAGATAFSMGMKTNNGYIGVDSLKKSHETIMETAMKKGYVTGLVATSTIVHATPASFAAHWYSRRDYEKIADQMSQSGVDIMIGGGKKYFDGRSTDDRNLLKEMTNAGYVCQTFFETDVSELDFQVNNKYLYLTANDSPIPASQGRDYLNSCSEKALNYLSQKSKNGFFIMIEGSQIDWGGHSNQFDYVMSELYEFDDVVGMALDFAEKDGETLVLVTADHETGGLSILKGSTPEDLKTNFSSDYHTAEMMPVFAYGPGAKHFMGIYENTEIYEKLKKALIW